MSKFLEVEVTRQQGTTVYIEVPDDFDPVSARHHVKLAAIHTVGRHEWDDDGWENTVELESVKVVTEEEEYKVYKAI